MSAVDIIEELKSQGNESYKKVMMRHGAKEPIFGVKIEYMKKIQKRVKKDYKLALELFDSGVADAMYLAGLIADDKKMTVKDLRKWVKKAYYPMICEYTVPWVAAESNHGWKLGLEWIDSPEETVASAGWQTLSSLVAITEDEDLDLPALKKLLQRVERTIHDQPNRVKYVMNNFVIALGGAVKDLTAAALQAAAKIGPVEVDMGDSSCRVPSAADYIKKMRQRGVIGRKRKTAKC